MQLNSAHILRWFALVGCGIVETALIGRWLARLLAARPGNPMISFLYATTEWMIAPLWFLDAQQPRFGATLEFASLTLILVIPALGCTIWRFVEHHGSAHATSNVRRSS